MKPRTKNRNVRRLVRPLGDCYVLLLERMPWDDRWTIRVVMPGLDGGKSAVWLEATCDRKTKREAANLARQVADKLHKAVYVA